MVPLVGVLCLLVVLSGCYYEVADNTPPWSNVSNTTSGKTVTRAWYNVGAVYGCSNATVDNGWATTVTTTCSQNQQQDWTTTTTIVDRYYVWIYRHVNRASNGTPDIICDAWYQSDMLGNDGTPVPAVADGNWYVTYNWTVSEMSGMHGCGSHQAAWFAHMEYRLVTENTRTSTVTNVGSDSRTVSVVTGSVTTPKPVIVS